MTYRVRTYDFDIGEYTPQTDPWEGLTLWQLKAALKELKECGYTCHRTRGTDGEHWDNDTSVLVEREDQLIEAHRLPADVTVPPASAGTTS